MFLGQRGSTNPTALLQSLLSKREKLQEELRNIEKQVIRLYLVAKKTKQNKMESK